MKKNNNKLSNYLDGHDYPAVFYRSPVVACIVFAINFVVTLRNWYVYKALRMEEKKHSADFSFLDAGFGMGEFAIGVAKRCPYSRVFGIDFMDSNRTLAAFVARSMYLNNAEFKKGDLTELDDREKYDLILCNSTLQFIEEDKKALRNICTAMKQNGILILYVPVTYRRYFPWSETIENSYMADHFYKYHEKFMMHRYNKNDILEKITGEGLKIYSLKYAYGMWGTIAFELYMLILVVIKRLPLIVSIPAVIIYTCSIFPIQLIFMLMDFLFLKSTGNGLLITAGKNTLAGNTGKI